LEADRPPVERLPLGPRFAALALDLLPAFGPVVVAGTIGAIWFDRGSGGTTDLDPAAGVVVVLAALWPIAYFGRRLTIGKARVGAWVEVAGHGGRGRLRGLWAVLPTASFAWPFLAPLLALDAAWALADGRRALHDRVAGTEVLREVRESASIRELRLAGADARLEYAAAAVEWAADQGATGSALDEVRRAVDAAAADPYQAQAAWSRAVGVAAEPLAGRLSEEQIQDPDFEDPELERLYEAAEAAAEQARARITRPRA
jgi:hypothetical protein